MEHLNSDIVTYVLLPLFIFFARIFDVSLGTLRIIFVTKGMRKVAPFVGFFEVLIWLLAISRIMQDLDNWVSYVAYAGGFATGGPHHPARPAHDAGDGLAGGVPARCGCAGSGHAQMRRRF